MHTPIRVHSLFLATLVLASTSTQAAPITGINPLEDGPLGLYSGNGLKVATGRCPQCATTPQALWYFQNEVIAVPKASPSIATTQRPRIFPASANGAAIPAEPPLIWLGAKEVIPQARLSADGTSLRLPDGQNRAFSVTPKIPSNLSYYDASSRDYLVQHPLRLRGDTVMTPDGRPGFVASTLWPLDFSLAPTPPLQPLADGETLRQLVKANNGNARSPFTSRLLWERTPGQGRDWNGKAVFAVMLNGAQGDDDEAHGGHFAIATGRFRADGDWSRWLVYNFYNLNSVSEKGIIAAPTPMDKYLFDLNSGQNWYRPAYMLVAVLRQERAALAYQAKIADVYDRFYRHDFEYNHANANCAGISKDALTALGWHPRDRGHEPWPKAIAAYGYVAATSGSLGDGRKIYDYLLEESTRLYPAATFDALGEDLLQLATGRTGRPLTGYERALSEDVEAILYVRIPQIPSSRAFGQAPVYSFDEYMKQAPADRSQWKIIPVAARPFPDELKNPAAPAPTVPAKVPAPVAIVLALLGGILFLSIRGLLRWISRRRFPEKKQ